MARARTFLGTFSSTWLISSLCGWLTWDTGKILWDPGFEVHLPQPIQWNWRLTEWGKILPVSPGNCMMKTCFCSQNMLRISMSVGSTFFTSRGPPAPPTQCCGRGCRGAPMAHDLRWCGGWVTPKNRLLRWDAKRSLETCLDLKHYLKSSARAYGYIPITFPLHSHIRWFCFARVIPIPFNKDK